MRHRLNGRNVAVESGEPYLRPPVERRRTVFQAEFDSNGFSVGCTRAEYGIETTALMVIRFTPYGARTEPPAPDAGRTLEMPR